jgi:hypothetical protein
MRVGWWLPLWLAACNGDGKDPVDDTDLESDDTDLTGDTDPLVDDTDPPTDDTDPLADDTDGSETDLPDPPDTDPSVETGVIDTFQAVDSASGVDTYDTLLLDTDIENDSGIVLDLFGDGQVLVNGQQFIGTETWHYRRRFVGTDLCVFQYTVRDWEHHPNPPVAVNPIVPVCVGCEFWFTAVLDEYTELTPPGWCAGLALPRFNDFFPELILGYGYGTNEFYSYYFQPQIWAPYPGIVTSYDPANGHWHYLSPIELDDGWYQPPP